MANLPASKLEKLPATLDPCRQALLNSSVKDPYRLYSRLLRQTRPPAFRPHWKKHDRVLLVRSFSFDGLRSFLRKLPLGMPLAIIDRPESQPQLLRLCPQALFIPYAGQSNFNLEGFTKIRSAIDAFKPTRVFFLSGNATASGYTNIIEGLSALDFEPLCFTSGGKFLRFPLEFQARQQASLENISELLDENWRNPTKIFSLHRRSSRAPRIMLDLRVLGAGAMTGVGRFAFNLARALAKRTRAFGVGAGKVQPPGVRAFNQNIPEGNPELASKHLAFLASCAGVDFYFSPYPCVPERAHCARFLTIHDLIPLKFPQWAASARAVEFFKTTLRQNARLADHVFAVSACTQADIVSLYGISPERITVLPNAVDHRRFHPVRHPELSSEFRRLMRKLGLRKGYLLSLCTLEPRKNIPCVLETFRLFCERNPASARQLLLIGQRGWEGNRLEELLAAHPFRERIIVSGYLPDALLPALYSDAFAFLFPSYYEGFGLPPLEALACGTPVLCSDTPSLVEVCADAALFAAPDDAEGFASHLDTLRNVGLRESLRHKGLVRARHFTWEKSAEILLRTAQKFL